jgi:hypothetical protein
VRNKKSKVGQGWLIPGGELLLISPCEGSSARQCLKCGAFATNSKEQGTRNPDSETRADCEEIIIPETEDLETSDEVIPDQSLEDLEMSDEAIAVQVLEDFETSNGVVVLC